jgi:hypothetical protein
MLNETRYTCLGCKQLLDARFDGWGKRARYCNQECKAKDYLRKAREVTKRKYDRLESRVCLWCRSEFKPKRTTQKYCSRLHMTRARFSRAREKYRRPRKGPCISICLDCGQPAPAKSGKRKYCLKHARLRDRERRKQQRQKDRQKRQDWVRQDRINNPERYRVYSIQQYWRNPTIRRKQSSNFAYRKKYGDLESIQIAKTVHQIKKVRANLRKGKI